MKTYHVVPRDDGQWAVIREGATRAASLHTTKQQAISKAKTLKSSTVKKSLTTSSVSNTADNAKEAFGKQLGERLQRARVMRGYSLRSLAESLNNEISHTLLQKYEKALVIPDTKVLGDIASHLGLRINYFFKSNKISLQTVEYRKQSGKLGKKAQSQLEEQAFEFFERYLEIESILDIKTPKLEQTDLSACKKEDLEDAIENLTEKLRKQWGLGSNPIPNIHTMLENNGIKVRVLPHRDGFDGLSAFASDGSQRFPTMALSDECFVKDLPRFRFSELHELGHLAMILPKNLEHRDKERMCHRFASSLLIPRSSFKKAIGDKRKKMFIDELAQVKAEWGMSIAALMRRAKDLEVITEGAYKGYCIWSRKTGFYKKEPQTWVGKEDSNRFEQLVLRAFAEGVISSSKASGLLSIKTSDLSSRADSLI